MDKSQKDEEIDLHGNIEEISDNDLENSINILQNAINIVKSQRKQTEQETKIMSKLIFLMTLSNIFIFIKILNTILILWFFDGLENLSF